MMRLLILLVLIAVSTNGVGKSLPPKLHKQLTNAEALIDKKSYKQAQRLLQTLLANNSGYSKAIIYTTISSLYSTKGQFQKAAEQLNRALQMKALPKTQTLSTSLNLAQLYIIDGKHTRALETLDPYLGYRAVPAVNALAAHAYAQLKKFANSLELIKKAINASKSGEVAENWYQLSLALYFELHQYEDAQKLLERLLELYPEKKIYWQQLSSVHQQLRDYPQATAVQLLAYEKGILTDEKSLLNLTNLLLYTNAPYQASQLLAREIQNKRIASTAKNWEILANAHTVAKDFDAAITALENASKLQQKGALYQRLGQIYIEQEQWRAAITSLNKAIGKGKIKNIGNTYLLLGMAYHETSRPLDAKKAFMQAGKDKKSRKSAAQWLNFIATQ